MPLATGTNIGRFVLTEPLGVGGFGITYKAEDPILGRTIAIKELFLDGCQRDGVEVTGGTIFRQTRDRFLAEARLLAGLDEHPNLLAVHEVIQANGTVYIAMAFVQGRTSKALLAGSQGGLPELRVLGIMEQVAAALDHVHACGVLHRDVKPDNVMLAPKPRGWPYEDWVILIDFGAARELLDHSQAMTRVLTPGFAPLEQYAESYRYGAPLDVYGLAATAYYLLSGKVPVNAADRSIVDRLIPLRELRPDLSDEMVAGITKGLALRPDERIQSPSALVDACRSGGSVSREWMSSSMPEASRPPSGSAPVVDLVPPTSPTIPVGSMSDADLVPPTSPTIPVGSMSDVDLIPPTSPSIPVGSSSALDLVPLTSPTIPVGSSSALDLVPLTSPTIPVGSSSVEDLKEAPVSEPPTAPLPRVPPSPPAPEPVLPTPVVAAVTGPAVTGPAVTGPVVAVPVVAATIAPAIPATATEVKGRRKFALPLGLGALAVLVVAGGLAAVGRRSIDRERSAAASDSVEQTLAASTTLPVVAPSLDTTPPEDPTETVVASDDTDEIGEIGDTNETEPTAPVPVDPLASDDLVDPVTPVAPTGPVGPLTASLAVGASNGAAWGWTPGGLLAASTYYGEPEGSDAETFDVVSLWPPGTGTQEATATIVNPEFVLSDDGSGFVDVRWSKEGNFLVTRIETDNLQDFRSVLECNIRVFAADGTLKLINPCSTDLDWLDEDHLVTIDGPRATVLSLDGTPKRWPEDIGDSVLVRSSANGREVAVVDSEGIVQVFTLGPDLLPIAVRALSGSVGTPTSLRWVGTRHSVVVAGSDGILLWDLDETSKDPVRIEGRGTAVGATLDGSLLAFDDGSTATVVSVADRAVVARFEHEPFADVDSIAFTSTNDLVALNGTAADGSGLRRSQYWYLSAS